MQKEIAAQDVTCKLISESKSPLQPKLFEVIDGMRQLESWGNGRDAVSMAQRLVSAALEDESSESQSVGNLVLDDSLALKVVQDFLKQRQAREGASFTRQPAAAVPEAIRQPDAPRAPAPLKAATATAQAMETDAEVAHEQGVQRDRGVSDAVWEQLQKDKAEAPAEPNDEEERAQKRLRQMGLCVAGYQWIRQSTGYRCAGGSHFVSHDQLK